MVRYFFILFLLLSSGAYSQTIWYISPSGNDGTGAGTSDNPWRTLYKAVNDPEVAEGDVISAAAGSYTEVQQIIWPDGVNIVGVGIDQTIFHLHYPSGPCIKAESYGYWGNTAYGNQSISYCTLDGDLTGQSAIAVNFRSNVKIHHVKVIDFYQSGVTFYGQATAAWTGTHPFESWKKMPNAWCTGNEVTNCIFTNNSIYTAHGYGNLQYGQQDGFIVSGCTITQTGRSAGSSGYGIKFYEEGFNKNTDIHNNTITIAPRESEKYNFSIENWNDMGGCQYYNNNLQGQVDFTNTYDLIGAGYGSWFHDNIVGFASTPTNTEVGVTPEAGLVDKCIISDNIFRNLTSAIILQHIYPNETEHPGTGTINNVRIYNNLAYNIGETSTGGRWTYGSLAAIAIQDYEYNSGNVTDSVFIDNNTLVASGIVRSSTYMSTGFLIAGNQTLTNIRFRNNIVKGFTGATSYNAGIAAYGTMPNTNLLIQNNDFNGNGNSNAPLWFALHGGQFATGTGYSYTNNITTDPYFVSTTDYRLTSGSGAIGAGTPVGLTYDILNHTWNATPSMGAYEYLYANTTPTITTTVVTDITGTTATSGGYISSDGGASVSARGVCWSTSANPTTADSHTSDGTGTGSFTSSITGLTNGTTYHVRAYATNSVGTSYGTDRTFSAGTETSTGVQFYEHNDILLIHNGQFLKP